MGDRVSRLPGDPAEAETVQVDVGWMEVFAKRFADTPVVATAEEALSTLGEVGLDVSRAKTSCEMTKLRGPTRDGTMLPADVPVEDALTVYSYCMEDPPAFSKVSKFLNNVSDRGSRESAAHLRSVMPWQKKLDESLKNLPESFDFQGEGYRGMRFSYPDFEEQFEVGKILCWYTNKSCGTEKRVMREDALGFCGSNAGPRTVFIIHGMKGKHVGRFSPFPKEKEVILRAMTFFKVLRVRRGDHMSGDPFDGHADIIELEMLPWSPPRCSADVLKLVRENNIKDPPKKTKLNPEAENENSTLLWGSKHGPNIEVDASGSIATDAAADPRDGGDGGGRYRPIVAERGFSEGVHCFLIKLLKPGRLLVGLATDKVGADYREGAGRGLHQTKEAWTLCLHSECSGVMNMWHGDKANSSGLESPSVGATVEILLDCANGTLRFKIDGSESSHWGPFHSLPKGEAFYPAMAFGGDDVAGASVQLSYKEAA